MKRKSYSIDAAMVFNKFYCHQCGNKLTKSPYTRTIKRGDPEYKEHSHIGFKRVFGDVDLIEYDFKCCNCNKIISPDEQYVINKVQKIQGKHILSEEELLENKEKAYSAIQRKRKITDIIVKVLFIVAIIVSIYYAIKTNNFSLKFHLI